MFKFKSYLLVALLGFATLFWYSCKKDDSSTPTPTSQTGPPKVTASVISDTTQTSAKASAVITSDSGSAITSRGFVWAKTTGPDTTLSTKVKSGTGAGSFDGTIGGLTSNTRYFVRSFAANAKGLTYGTEVEFTTKQAIGIPSLTTDVATGIGNTTAKSGGSISDDGGSPVLARGVVWGTSENPDVSLSTKTTDGDGTGAFTSTITSLSQNTKYFVRAYATNDNGTGYGNQISFTTKGGTPVNVTFNVNMSNEILDAAGVHIAGSFQTTPWTPGANAMTAGAGGAYSFTLSTTPGTTIEYKFINGASWNGKEENITGTCGAGNGNRVLTVGTSDQTVTFCYNSCEATCAQQVPTLVTNPATGVTLTNATIGGNVLSENGASVTEKGVWYGDFAEPGPGNGGIKLVASSGGLGAFSTTLSTLTHGRTYHFQAYATNSAGTAKGASLTFTTLAVQLPTVTTTAVTNITTTSATSGGNVTNNGGGNVTARGIVYGTSVDPSLSNGAQQVLGGTGTGSFISTMNVTAGQTYHVRAFATNSAGTSYGQNLTFSTTSIQPPSLSTNGASNISSNSAISGGNITSLGNGTLSQAGVCWNTTGNPTIANAKTTDGSLGAFTSTIAGLNFNTRYFVRAYATNQAGTSYGNQIEFTTKSNLTIGQNFGGGKLAYEFVPGEAGFVFGENHGLVAQASDKGSFVWAQKTGGFGCLTFTPNFPTGGNTGLGEGYNATEALLLYDDATNCISNAPAARSCWADDATGGQTDWYLPNTSELQKLYDNRNAIGGFTSGIYWTSITQQSTGGQVQYINFADGGQFVNGYANTYNVRAVRKF